MGLSNLWSKVFRASYVFLVFFLISALPGQSQTIFLSDSPGLLSFGQFSKVQHLENPEIGFSYSFNGKSAVGISYGSSSLGGTNYQNWSILANHLIKKQATGDPVNIEVIPAFERKYHNSSEHKLSLFSLTSGISRDLSSRSETNIIPRVTLSYLVSPSVGVRNFLSAGMDMNFALNLTKNFKFIANPGVNVRLDKGRYNGIFMGGLLIY